MNWLARVCRGQPRPSLACPPRRRRVMVVDDDGYHVLSSSSDSDDEVQPSLSEAPTTSRPDAGSGSQAPCTIGHEYIDARGTSATQAY